MRVTATANMLKGRRDGLSGDPGLQALAGDSRNSEMRSEMEQYMRRMIGKPVLVTKIRQA
jgi:hypothetical protein